MSSDVELFITPFDRAETEIVVKKSRFIGHLVPIRSVADAEEKLSEIQTAHKTATHNCYAYTFGLKVPIERFSDDGEPSGTAGRPILEVLRRRHIRNALLVVTRYFGGTLLGASGLVHAYSDASVAVLDAAELLDCRLLQRLVVTMDYGLYGKLEYELTQRGCTLYDKAFSEVVSLAVWAVPAEVDGLRSAIAEWSGGRALVDCDAPRYVGVRADGELIHGVWPEDDASPADPVRCRRG